MDVPQSGQRLQGDHRGRCGHGTGRAVFHIGQLQGAKRRPVRYGVAAAYEAALQEDRLAESEDGAGPCALAGGGDGHQGDVPHV